jgi:glycosyltransferase involved in cell wall biosynthesis
MKEVCYFGIYDPKHWRTRIIKRTLENAGYRVHECRVDPRETKGLSKYLELYRKYRNLSTEFDWVVIGFPGYLAVIFARLITGSPIIFDAYISYFDGIRDRRDYPIIHPKMWLAWLIDFIDGLCADVVLTINYAYKDFFVRALKVKESKVEVLHKGADEAVFFPSHKNERLNNKFMIGWWGSFIPLHGLPIIIEAANLLRDNSDIEFNIIGSGQLAGEIRKIVDKYQLKNVNMIPFIPKEELVKSIAEFDIVLGIFAPTPKSGRCVTNKVYEALAMGKPIVTQDSRANREIFVHKENAYLVAPGNPEALAEAIRELTRDEKLREKIAANGLKMFQERFISKEIEEEFLDIIKRHNV